MARSVKVHRRVRMWYRTDLERDNIVVVSQFPGGCTHAKEVTTWQSDTANNKAFLQSH